MQATPASTSMASVSAPSLFVGTSMRTRYSRTPLIIVRQIRFLPCAARNHLDNRHAREHAAKLSQRQADADATIFHAKFPNRPFVRTAPLFDH